MVKQTGEESWDRLGLVPRIALIAAGTFPAIGLFSMGAALPAIERGFADTQNAALMIQIVIGLVAPLFALASPLAGRLVAQHGVRSIYLVSIVLFLIGGLGPAICSALWAMIPFRVVLALGIAGVSTAGYSGIARVPEKQRHTMIGMLNFAGGAISIAAFPLVGFLAQQDWDLAFLVHLIVVPLALTAFALPRRSEPTHVEEVGTEPVPAKPLAGLPIILLVIAVVAGWSMVGSSIYSPVYLSSIGMSDSGRIGSVLAIMAACSLLGSGSYGYVQRLFGTHKMLLLGLALTGSGCVVIGASGAITGATVGLGLMGAGLAVCVAAIFASAIEAIGPTGNVGGAMGVMNLAMFGPQILFPPIALAIGASGGPSLVYYLLAALYAACLVIAGTTGPAGKARAKA